MNSSHKRPTQKDVAQVAGVNRSTVSLALKNHPGLPKSTKDKIRKIAEQIGYVPDPMLSALAHYRHLREPKKYQGTLAWFVNDKPPYDWRKIEAFHPYYESSCEHAQKLGYKVEVFNLQAPNMSPERLSSIFKNRNIRGLLLCPQPLPNTEIHFPWEHFSVVTFGYSLVRPSFHTVVPAQFRNAVLATQKLLDHGYKRIGYAFTHFHDDRMDHNCLGGYLAAMTSFLNRYPIPPLLKPKITPDDFRKWYNKHHPDAILLAPDIPNIIAKSGLRVPEDVGAACPLLHQKNSPISGICENPLQIGVVAVDFLVSMIQRGETGIPSSPQRILVEGAWNEGKTLLHL